MYQSPKIKIQKFNNLDIISISGTTFPQFLTENEKELMNNLVYKNDKKNIIPRNNHYNIKKGKIFCKLYKNKAIIVDSNGRYSIFNNELKEYFDHCSNLYSQEVIIHSRILETLNELKED